MHQNWAGERRNENTGTLVARRETTTHQRVGDESGDVCGEIVHQRQDKLPRPYSSGQHYNEGNDQQNGQQSVNITVGSSSRSVAILHQQTDHNYCRIFAGGSELDGGQTVQMVQGQQQLATRCGAVSTATESNGTLGDRSLCGQVEQPIAEVHELETRSLRGSDRCLFSELEQIEGICVPSILSDWEVPCESETGTVTVVADSTGVEHTAMVCGSVVDAHGLANSTPTDQEIIDQLTRGEPPVTGERPTAISGMANIRQRWEMQGFSEQAMGILDKARREGTKSAYSSAWKKWTGWCHSEQIDPFQASMADIINFMSRQCKDGLEYRTLNVYRSAISAFHPLLDGHKVGQHPDMKMFMAGAFNEKPPQPKYTSTWDVNKVLQFVKGLGENAILTDKLLTMKLVMLLTLTNVKRAHELQFINPSLMEDYGDRVVLHIAKLTKTKRPAKPYLSLILHKYEVEELDVVQCLRAYLARTAHWRVDGSRQEQLFLSFVKPHGPVSSATISRWLKDLMSLAGIDTDKFKGHSVRGAATSKVWNAGLTVEQILEKANWSGANTFLKFYGREVVEKDVFQQTLFQ